MEINSRILLFEYEYIKENKFPCCLKENKYKQYLALKKEKNINIINIIFDQFKILFNNPISLNKFSEGGADIFLEHNKNHHIDILGIKFNIPLLIIKLRLLDRS